MKMWEKFFIYRQYHCSFLPFTLPSRFPFRRGFVNKKKSMKSEENFFIDRWWFVCVCVCVCGFFFFLSLKIILRIQRSLAKKWKERKERKEGMKKRENFFILLSEFSSSLPFCCRCDLAEK